MGDAVGVHDNVCTCSAMLIVLGRMLRNGTSRFSDEGLSTFALMAAFQSSPSPGETQ